MDFWAPRSKQFTFLSPKSIKMFLRNSIWCRFLCSIKLWLCQIDLYSISFLWLNFSRIPVTGAELIESGEYLSSLPTCSSGTFHIEIFVASTLDQMCTGHANSLNHHSQNWNHNWSSFSMSEFGFCSFESRECIFSSTSKTVTFFATLLWKIPQKEQQTCKVWSIQFHEYIKRSPYIPFHFIYWVKWLWAKMMKLFAWNLHLTSIFFLAHSSKMTS